MSQHTCVGVGCRHSNLDTSFRKTGASNNVTRVTSRSITGHTLPIQVHQHYGLEFHLVLTADSCIRRGCYTGVDTHQICTQLERRLEGLCSCVFDESRVLTLSKSNSVLGPHLYRTCFEKSVTATLIRRSPHEIVGYLRIRRLPYTVKGTFTDVEVIVWK